MGWISLAERLKATEDLKLLDSTDPKKQEWLAWAEEKADWFDPAIASEDPIFGVRKHTESNDQKELKTLYSTWQLGYKHI